MSKNVVKNDYKKDKYNLTQNIMYNSNPANSMLISRVLWFEGQN